MADDETYDDAEQAGADPKQRAQGAAGDLRRMGIDPRSLGLDDQAAAPPPPPSPPSQSLPGSVVPLRPDLPMPPRPDAPERPVTSTEALRERALRARNVESPASEAPVTGVQAFRERALQNRSADPAPVVRKVVRGLTTPDAAAAAQGERELIDLVRQRQTDRRVVTFMSAQGGVGCTTIAVAVGITLTAMRDDSSVVVDVQSGALSLCETYAADGMLSVNGLLADAQRPTLPHHSSALALIDGPGWEHGLGRQDISSAIERLSSDHVFHLLDTGNEAGEGAHAALARADRVAVIVGPGETGARAFAVALDRLRLVNPAAAAGAVQVVVCQHEAAQREAAPSGAIVVPPDEHLAAARPYAPDQVSAGTREAALRVAAAVVRR